MASWPSSAAPAMRCVAPSGSRRNSPPWPRRGPRGHRIFLRVGINLGDVKEADGDIYGDGVNVAARLEALAEPGGIVVSASVRDNTRGRFEALFEDMGEQRVKGIRSPVRAFRMRPAASDKAATWNPALALPDRPSIAVLPFQNLSGDPSQEYFADGIVTDIITALSQIRSFFVIAAVPRSTTGSDRSTPSRSRASLACSTCWMERCARAAIGYR